VTVPNPTNTDRPAAVYRLYDAEGTLLYIGSAYDPDDRWEEHQKKPWAAEVAKRVERWYPDRNAAYVAETAAIKSELPRHNITNNPAAPPRVIAGVNPLAQILDRQIREIESIEDDAEAALAATRLIDEYAPLPGWLRAKRQGCVRSIRATGKTWDQIGALLSMTPQRAQQIATGVSGAQRRKAEAARKSEAQDG
jgi:predicted GIY-YIG superfamily endonuclease